MFYFDNDNENNGSQNVIVTQNSRLNTVLGAWEPVICISNNSNVPKKVLFSQLQLMPANVVPIDRSYFDASLVDCVFYPKIAELMQKICRLFIYWITQSVHLLGR